MNICGSFSRIVTIFWRRLPVNYDRSESSLSFIEVALALHIIISRFNVVCDTT